MPDGSNSSIRRPGSSIGANASGKIGSASAPGFSKENYQLLMHAENGLSGVFDVSLYLESEAFLPLRKKENFNTVSNGGYFIAWDCGADLSADTIEAKWRIA